MTLSCKWGFSEEEYVENDAQTVAIAAAVVGDS